MKYLRSNKLCAIWEISSNGLLEYTVYVFRRKVAAYQIFQSAPLYKLRCSQM